MSEGVSRDVLFVCVCVRERERGERTKEEAKRRSQGGKQERCLKWRLWYSAFEKLNCIF